MLLLAVAGAVVGDSVGYLLAERYGRKMLNRLPHRLVYRTFVLWNVVGAAVWGRGFVMLGYLAGSQYQRIEHAANYVSFGLLAAVVLVLVRLHRARRCTASPASASTRRPEPVRAP